MFTVEEHTTSAVRPLESFTIWMVHAERLTQFAAPGFHSLYGWHLVLESGSRYLLESLAKFNEILFLSMIGRHFMQIGGRVFICTNLCVHAAVCTPNGMACHSCMSLSLLFPTVCMSLSLFAQLIFTQSDLTSSILLAD